MASVLLNRYLDINQIIDDPDSNNIAEDDEFAQTDIPSPYNVNLPMKNMISEQEKEHIKDWLLDVSMNEKFESKLQWENVGHNEVCILTGEAVTGINGKQCPYCKRWGKKDAWTIYLGSFSRCPFCGGNNP